MAGERTLPGLGLTGFWTPGTNGWDTGNDVNLRTLSALTQLSVISATTALPAGADGDIYIVPTGEAEAEKVAVKDSGAWVYLTAIEGWTAFARDTDSVLRFDGATWEEATAAASIATLSDVDLTGLADGDVLVWDAAGSEWIPGEGGGGALPSATPWHGARRPFTSVTVPAAVYTKIALDAADFDTLSFSNVTDGFTIPAGVSRVRFRFYTVSNTPATDAQFNTRLNGAALPGSNGGVTSGIDADGFSNTGSSALSGAISVSEGDTLELSVYSASATAQYTGWFEIEVLEGSALSMAAAVPVTINAQTGTSYTAALADAQALVTMDNAGANTFTLPANAAVAFPVGTMISVKQKGAGVTTGEAPSGGTLNGVTDGSCAFSAQWATLTFTKLGTDEWTVDGLNDGVS